MLRMMVWNIFCQKRRDRSENTLAQAVRWAAAKSLGNMGEHGAQHADALAALLKDRGDAFSAEMGLKRECSEVSALFSSAARFNFRTFTSR